VDTIGEMAGEEIQHAKGQVIAEHGAWTAHNIALGEGVFTRDEGPSGEELKLRRAVGLIADLTGKPWSDLRILDLGCLEGLYAVEFARRGAEVVGIEVRRPNIEKARFARDALGLETLELLEEDVRELSRERHGEFDVVLCWGILYHLTVPAVFEFAERMADVCRGFAIIDTHVALDEADMAGVTPESFWIDPAKLGPVEEHEHGGHVYRGRMFHEHPPETSSEEIRDSLWAALDHDSFWLTMPSLLNLLRRSGFGSVLRADVPALPGSPPDRPTLVAFRSVGQQPLLSVPYTDPEEDAEVPEADPPPETLPPPPEPPPPTLRDAARTLKRALKR
jgi:SAM-dependent methyltransferase